MGRSPDQLSEQANVDAVRRILIGTLILVLIAIFLIWRIESERMERVRAELTDMLIPLIQFSNAPARFFQDIYVNARNYISVVQRNEELENEVRQLRANRERVIYLEGVNAELMRQLRSGINSETLTASARVVADASSPYRHSVIVNVGESSGIRDGWPVVDENGLVGRITGIADSTARVLLLSDPHSRVPVKIGLSGYRGILSGDNTITPTLELLVDGYANAGDRVTTSGHGGVFPPDINIGTVLIDSDRQHRVRLASDMRNLDFVSIYRVDPPEPVVSAGGLVIPEENGPDSPRNEAAE